MRSRACDRCSNPARRAVLAGFDQVKFSGPTAITTDEETSGIVAVPGAPGWYAFDAQVHQGLADPELVPMGPLRTMPVTRWTQTRSDPELRRASPTPAAQPGFEAAAQIEPGQEQAAAEDAAGGREPLQRVRPNQRRGAARGGGRNAADGQGARGRLFADALVRTQLHHGHGPQIDAGAALAPLSLIPI